LYRDFENSNTKGTTLYLLYNNQTLLLCHPDKKQAKGQHVSAPQRAFLNEITDRLLQLSESLDDAKRFESRLQVMAIDAAAIESIIKQYVTDHSLIKFIPLLEPQLFDWMLRERLDLSIYSHLISTAQAKVFTQKQIERSIKKMTTFKTKAELLDMMKTIGLIAQALNSMDEFPLALFGSKMRELAFRRGDGFIYDAMTVLYEQLDTWKILKVYKELPGLSVIAMARISRRYIPGHSLFKLLMLNEPARGAMGISSFKELVYSLRDIYSEDISIHALVSKMQNEINLIEIIEDENKSMTIACLDLVNFGNPEITTEFKIILDLLSRMIWPGAKAAKLRFKELINHFIARGIISSDTPLEAINQMGYAVKDVLNVLRARGDRGYIDGYSAGWKLESFHMHESISELRQALRKIENQRRAGNEGSAIANQSAIHPHLMNLIDPGHESQATKTDRRERMELKMHKDTISDLQQDYGRLQKRYDELKTRVDEKNCQAVPKGGRQTNQTRGGMRNSEDPTKRTEESSGSRTGWQEHRHRNTTNSHQTTQKSFPKGGLNSRDELKKRDDEGDGLKPGRKGQKQNKSVHSSQNSIPRQDMKINEDQKKQCDQKNVQSTLPLDQRTRNESSKSQHNTRSSLPSGSRREKKN
jgi:hypothetical protein